MRELNLNHLPTNMSSRYGAGHSNETRAKQSANANNRVHSPEVLEKMRQASRKYRYHTPDGVLDMPRGQVAKHYGVHTTTIRNWLDDANKPDWYRIPKEAAE